MEWNKNDGIDTYRQETKTIEFSPIGDAGDNTGRFANEENIVHRETYGDGRKETKRERGGDKNDRKRQNFGKVSTITTEADQGKDHTIPGIK